MRMFGYYALHSFKNQIKKIFKAKILLFVLICAVVGGLIGYVAGTLSDVAEQKEAEEQWIIEEQTEEENAFEDENAPEEAFSPEEFLEEENEGSALSALAPNTPPEAFKYAMLELIIGAILLALFAFQIISADRNGGKIFLPADVNLLFPSPLRPQTVLFFRLFMQAGAILFASIYLLFQIPNLIFNVGLSVPAAFSILLVWVLMFLTGRFLQVLIYTVTSTRLELKKYIAPAVYSVLGVVFAGWLIFWNMSGLQPLDAVFSFFNGKYSRFIPIWGWLKGITMFAAEENIAGFLICLVLSIAALAVLIVLIRSVKADFYEDAMAKSEQTAELLEAAQSGRTFVTRSQEKKSRSEKLRRDGLNHGWGASVFFHRSLYNRFRFAKFGIFTKTAWTYLAAAALMAILSVQVFSTETPLIVVFVLAAFAFYRAMGNPLAEDTKMDFFRLIPESSFLKVFWSLLAGTVGCVLDMIPAMLLASVIMKRSPLDFLVWLPFIAAVDFYATNTSTFISLAVPQSVDKTVRQLVTVLFLYFGLVPTIGIMAVALILDHALAGTLIAIVVNVGFGFLFMMLSASLLEPYGGRAVMGTGWFGDITRVKKDMSRIGVSLAVMFCSAAVLQLLIAYVIGRVNPAWQENPWLFWGMTFVPLYCIAVPVGLKIMSRVPKEPVFERKLSFGKWISAFFICMFLMYTGNLIGTGIVYLLNPGASAVDLNPIYKLMTTNSKFFQLAVTVILAPIIEETIFRKFLITRIRPYGEKLAIVTSALCFGLFHANLQQFIYATLIGLVFGYVYTRTGKLRYSIALHMAVNALGNIATLLIFGNDAFQETLSSGDPAKITELFSNPEILVPLIATVIYFLFIIIGYIVGLVLFVIRVRSLVFEPTEKQLPRGTGFKTVWGNVGMIVFSAVCVLQIILILCGVKM